MFRIFVIIISCFAICAQAATPESLEQINKDLLSKKSNNEPFKDKDVKVDVESLGLDEIDAKDAKTAAAKEPVKPVVESTLPNLKTTVETPQEPVKKAPVTMEDKIKAMMQKSESEVKKITTTKTKEVVRIRKVQDKNTTTVVTKTTAPVVAKAAKKSKTTKKPVAKKSSEEKKSTKNKAEENEKKRKAKLTKLNQLRAKYLLKVSKEKISNNKDVDEDWLDQDEKLIPQKKDINKFVSYERPAPPILDRYRSAENGGIPLVISAREKADILFRSIGSEDISDFNSAYSGVENPDLRNNVGDTILTYSILLQKREVVASILARGANPNLANGLGYTPLQITIESLDLLSFNLLVNAGADINAIDGFGRTPLMYAARVGFLGAMDVMIKKGADVNAMDYDGFSALSIAHKYKQDLAIALLLKYGAKPWVEKAYDPEPESIIKQLDTKWKR